MKTDREFLNFNFYKIIATLYIALLHFGFWGVFTGNANMQIWVEYFYIIAGILLAKSYCEKGKEPLDYILNRLKRLLPGNVLFLLLYFILMAFHNYEDFLYCIKYVPLSVFGLQVFGIGEFGRCFGPTWYVSVLILCSFIIYCELPVRSITQPADN